MDTLQVPEALVVRIEVLKSFDNSNDRNVYSTLKSKTLRIFGC